MLVQRSLLGASVSRPKEFGFRHRGTCADPQCWSIVDTMPETGAQIVQRPVFSAGQEIRIDSLGVTPADEWLRAQRALIHVGRVPYANANCDVLATYAESGQAWSPQLAGALAAAAAVGLLIWAARS